LLAYTNLTPSYEDANTVLNGATCCKRAPKRVSA
jgi:hypothetical protein